MSTKVITQVCRKCLKFCIPAVTKEFDNGSRKLYWCVDHVADSLKY